MTSTKRWRGSALPMSRRRQPRRTAARCSRGANRPARPGLSAAVSVVWLGKGARGSSSDTWPSDASASASARRRAVPTGENAATWWHGHSCRASGCPFHRAHAASIELIAQLRRDVLRYQPIQMVGGEATTTVGQRRAESPLLLHAHRLALASPAAGSELKHAGERRLAIHATPVLVKTPAG